MVGIEDDGHSPCVAPLGSAKLLSQSSDLCIGITREGAGNATIPWNRLPAIELRAKRI
jgi:hypothetical protein